MRNRLEELKAIMTEIMPNTNVSNPREQSMIGGILTHSKTVKIVSHSLLNLHSRNTVLLWINITHYSSLFQYFFFNWYYVPTLRGYKFLVYQFANFIWNWIHLCNIATALLSLVNPRILHRNNGTACPTYVVIVWKEDVSLPAMFNPVWINNFLKRTSAIKVATMKIMDDFY